MAYAENTKISTAQTKGHIEDLLTKYGAQGFLTGWNEKGAAVGFVMHGKQIKFLLPLPDKADKKYTHYTHNSGSRVARNPEMAIKLWEQDCRARWRALLLCIKAKLEAVQQGITTFEHEFLAHFVVNGTQTVGDLLIPQIEQAQKLGKLPTLQIGM